MLKPKKLCAGDTISLIAPAYALRREDTEQCIANLEKMGYRVKLSENLYSTADTYAGSVQERAADFNAMIADPSVNMILFGGGEVCNEILPAIDFEAVRKNPKILCSYSDSTTILNAVTSLCDMVTLYGGSVSTFYGCGDYNMRAFRDRLTAPVCTYEKSDAWRVICSGACEGVLTGGYLVNYASLFATPYFKKPQEKYVLFLEDHKKFSSPAVVSKWFANLEMYGGFEGATGLIFGHYAEEEYPDIDRILRRLGEKYAIPVVRCNDFGHGRYDGLIPIGVHCRMNTETEEFVFDELAVDAT